MAPSSFGRQQGAGIGPSIPARLPITTIERAARAAGVARDA
jgi:hypothetical protein